MAKHLPNYLRTHRKRAGLTQRDVAFLLGNSDGAQLSRYEKHHRIPPLETALTFAAIFRKPVAELFAGLDQSATIAVQARLRELARQLEARNVTGASRKRLWLSETHDLRDNHEETIPCIN